jgi:hypothetical protein
MPMIKTPRREATTAMTNTVLVERSPYWFAYSMVPLERACTGGLLLGGSMITVFSTGAS